MKYKKKIHKANSEKYQRAQTDENSIVWNETKGYIRQFL